MEMRKVEGGKALVLLDTDDLLILSNALNEVCNGIEVPEFATRMGVSLEEALTMQRAVNAIYERLTRRT
jgi:hypothetical protein